MILPHKIAGQLVAKDAEIAFLRRVVEQATRRMLVTASGRIYAPGCADDAYIGDPQATPDLALFLNKAKEESN